MGHDSSRGLTIRRATPVHFREGGREEGARACSTLETFASEVALPSGSTSTLEAVLGGAVLFQCSRSMNMCR